ncbi:MAG: L-threonylcarbamoyladenylate synthase [Caldisericia bacterium]|nr:L-threonylcarbamoyladenylate synthase [Caldisericia bacterium]
MILRAENPPCLTEFEKKFCKNWLFQDAPLVFPTDTVMGIGVHGESYQAVCTLFRVKKREEKKPLILLLADLKDAVKYVSNPSLLLHPLIEKNWPGSVTGVFPMATQCSLYTTPQRTHSTIGIRVPSDPFLLDFLRYIECPFLTTSANISDEHPFQNPLEAQNVLGEESLILDIQREEITNQPSAVISFQESGDYRILREGVIRY